MKKKLIRATTVSMSTVFYVDIIPDLQEQGYEVVAVSSPGQELDEVRKKGAKVITVPMERHISPFKDLISLFRLISVFIKERPYIVHSITPKAGLLCMMAGWLTRAPRRVHMFTGLVWPTATGLSRKILMFTDWLTCSCATHVIPESQGVMNDLQAHITKKPMHVLGFGNIKGIDMEYWRNTPELNQPDPAFFTFLFVGRITKDKGINELVSAFCRLNSEHPKTRLWLVGPFEDDLDPVSDETRKLIETTPAIITWGERNRDELRQFYASSDCFVFPSYREGMPNTPIEAGAMGLPTIATDINGSREIIINGENGIVIPSKDADALYAAMEHMLLNTNGDRTRMASNARELIGSRFEQSFVRKCLYEYYNSL